MYAYTYSLPSVYALLILAHCAQGSSCVLTLASPRFDTPDGIRCVPLYLYIYIHTHKHKHVCTRPFTFSCFHLSLWRKTAWWSSYGTTTSRRCSRRSFEPRLAAGESGRNRGASDERVDGSVLSSIPVFLVSRHLSDGSVFLGEPFGRRVYLQHVLPVSILVSISGSSYYTRTGLQRENRCLLVLVQMRAVQGIE